MRSPGIKRVKVNQISVSKLLIKTPISIPTIVTDTGVATEENLQWLRENGYTYIVSARQKAPPIAIERELVTVMVSNSEKYQVKVAELPVNGQKKWLYCETPAKAATAVSIKTFF